MGKISITNQNPLPDKSPPVIFCHSSPVFFQPGQFPFRLYIGHVSYMLRKKTSLNKLFLFSPGVGNFPYSGGSMCLNKRDHKYNES